MAAEDKLKLAPFLATDVREAMGETPLKVAGDIRTKVRNERTARKVNLDRNWNMYQGDHSQYFKQRSGEPDDVYKNRVETAVIANYCKFIIDLSAKYAYGRPEKIRRQFTNPEVTGNNKTEVRMREIEDLISIQSFMLKSKRHAGTFGEQPVRLIPLDKKTGEQVTGNVTPDTYPHPILLDPRDTFVLKTSWGKMLGVVIEDEYTDFATSETVSTLELIVEDSRWYWEDDKLMSSEVNTYSLDSEFVCFDNSDTKKDEIEPIINLQIKFDEALTDAEHFFSKHGWPQMVSSIDLTNVMYNPQYVWQVESDGDGKLLDQIGFLTWDGRMKEAGDYRRELEVLIFKIASVAPMATGDPEAIGQLRTGAALVAAHGPSIQNATEKQVSWESNEKQLFKAIAKLDSNLHDEALDTRYPGFVVSIRFPHDFVPGEELVRAEIESMSLNSHTVAISDILRKNHPNATEEEIAKMRTEIIKDSTELTDSKREFLTETKEPISSTTKKSGEQKNKKET